LPGWSFVIKLLYLVSSLNYSGAARKVLTLATGLPRDRYEVRVAVFGATAPWADTLRRAGIAVEFLDWTRSLDVRPILRLRGVAQSFQPRVVHVWSRNALRCFAAAGTGRATRLLVSNLLKPGHPLAFWDRLLAHRADAVVAFSASEAERYRRSGVAGEIIATVAPGVEANRNHAFTAPIPGPLPNGRFVLGVGPLEMHKGFRDAVWALDILHYLYGDLHLVLAGSGNDRARIAHFAQAVGASKRVHFLGPVADVAGLMQRAAAVWVPSLIQGGVCVALEAMAAGKPVVGTRAAGLDEVIVDGETGFLVKPGDKAGLARQTRLLLDDPALVVRMGEAGRRRVLEHFTAGRMVYECERLYGGPHLELNPAVPP
jgi:glycosyltransferase involved in cell wall biosynthesis